MKQNVNVKIRILFFHLNFRLTLKLKCCSALHNKNWIFYIFQIITKVASSNNFSLICDNLIHNKPIFWKDNQLCFLFCKSINFEHLQNFLIVLYHFYNSLTLLVFVQNYFNWLTKLNISPPVVKLKNMLWSSRIYT